MKVVGQFGPEIGCYSNVPCMRPSSQTTLFNLLPHSHALICGGYG